MTIERRMVVCPTCQRRYRQHRAGLDLAIGPACSNECYVLMKAREHRAADAACGRSWQCSCVVCREVRRRGWGGKIDPG